MDHLAAWIARLATADAQELRRAYESLVADHPSTTETGTLARRGQKIALIDAIAELRFPDEWRHIRDAA